MRRTLRLERLLLGPVALSLLLGQRVAYAQAGQEQRPAPAEPPAQPAPAQPQPPAVQPPSAAAPAEPPAQIEPAQPPPAQPPPASPPEGAAPREQSPVAAPAPAAPAESPSPGPPPSPAAAPPTDTTATDTTQLDAVVVEDSSLSAEEAALQTVDAVPGAARLKDSSRDLQRQATTLTAADLLSFTPGVYAQASGGNQGFRLSIRGSSINNTNTYKFGVGFYFDGLLFPGIAQSGAPGFLFEPLTVNYTEIFPAANAFDFQPLQLGGAVNFVDHTGYTASPFQVRFDAGSFRYYKAQLSSGRVVGPADYYISATRSSSEGYQDHTEEEGTRLIANVGYEISPAVKTRFYFRWGKEYFENGGLLTPDQIEDSPTQASPTLVAQNMHYAIPSSYWWGNKTSFKIDDVSDLTIGVVYDNHIMHASSRGVENAYYIDYSEQNIAPSVVYSRWGTLFGKQSHTQISLRNTTVITSNAKHYDYTVPTSPTYGGQIRNITQRGTLNVVLSLSNDLEVVENLWLKTGLAGARTRSVSRVVRGGIVPQATVDNSNAVVEQFDWSGVLGLRYEFTPGVQVFGALSRTIEPPTGSRNNSTFSGAVDLKNQSATTVEVGTRVKASIFDGSLSYYYSAVRDELLTVATQLTPMIITATDNASPTTHQGVEAGLDTLIWHAQNSPKDRPHELSLRQAYTYSNFRFDDDPLWDSNQLPAIPEHFYQAELFYQHSGGFNVGVNTQAASEIAADFANTLYAPGYVSFGAKAGYAPSKDWEVHLDVKNITDEHYAAYVRQVANAEGQQRPIAAPADGFSVFGGFSLKF